MTDLTKPKTRKYDSHTKKPNQIISDYDFWSILEANFGLIGKTAMAIRLKFGKSFTYNAARVRAMKDRDRLEEILINNFDSAEAVYHYIIQSGHASDKDKITAADRVLNTQAGRARGYGKHIHVVTEDVSPLAGKTNEELIELIDHEADEQD